MKAKELYEALQLVRSAVPARSPREICKTVRIWILGRDVNLRGTDIEVGMQTTFHVEPEENCQGMDLCVQAELLAAVVREAGDAEMSLGAEEGASPKLLINYPGAEYWLNALPGSEFPELPKADGAEVEMDSAVLLGLLRRTAFAATRESMRYAINGVLLAAKDGRLEVVGTDGHRMAVASTVCDLEGEHRFVLPTRGVLVMEALLATGARASLAFGTDCLAVTVGESTMTSRPIDGAFPDYKAVIPKSNDKVITIGTKELTSAVKQAAILTSEASHAVRVDVASGMIDVIGHTFERGKAKVHRMALFDGDRVSVGFEPQYLLEFLRVFEEENVQVRIGKTDGVVMFCGDGEKEYLYLVMPVSVDE